MIQGCTSDAGKSVLVAGLCRYLYRQGIKVAPFKPQNMALNSAVTIDGGEIGRSQAVQAQACHLEPHSDFNPILLKPNSDTAAQVIVHGKAIDSMQAERFHAFKQSAMSDVLESYHRLENQYEAIIIEGAGSPAEINLRKNDIANMGFAESIDCPVILVADIDRGGVFAHLVGTLQLLSQSEQNRVVGLVINRFSGEYKLLESGIEWLEKTTNKPVLAVLPFLTDFYLDAEDAIANSQIGSIDQSKIKIKIIVPVLPRISNHTDFDALRLHSEVDLEFVAINQQPPACDLIILPGSKNVIKDFQSLIDAGWNKILDKHLRYGGKVIGICGGYQMLGSEISDPDEIESSIKKSDGFNYLPTTTILHKAKRLSRTKAQIINSKLDNVDVEGYEIHCGITTISDNEAQTASSFVKFNNGQTDGFVNKDNNILGTYLHGLFDKPLSCNALLKWAGLSSDKMIELDEIREQQLNRLADCIETNFDADFLQSLVSNKPPYRADGDKKSA